MKLSRMIRRTGLDAYFLRIVHFLCAFYTELQIRICPLLFIGIFYIAVFELLGRFDLLGRILEQPRTYTRSKPLVYG